MIQRHLLISHGQFYVGDSNLDWDPSEIWSDQASFDGIAVMPEALGMLTVRYGGYIQITIEVTEKRPEELWEAWDQVVEASIALPSGSLQLASPAADIASEPLIVLGTGTYRVRVCVSNLGAMENLLQKSAQSEQYSVLFYGNAKRVQPPSEAIPYESYHLIVWPDSAQALQMLKRYRRRCSPSEPFRSDP